jgi:hypothetical protein
MDDEAMMIGARGVGVALLFTASVTASLAHGQQGPFLQQPYPPPQQFPSQPYPQGPYPQSPTPRYPQQYPPQQYPQQYPQQQYPQQQYPQQNPPPGWSPPPPSEPGVESPDPAGFGYALALTGGGARTEVDQGPSWRTWAGGVFFHASASGFANHTSARVRLSGFLGGGGGGFESAAAVQAYIGLGAPISRGSQLFVRFGGNGYALKNDEIEANTSQFPGVQLGINFHTKGFGFELAPQAGLSARTEYEPGDEEQGRRYWRRMGSRGSAGGLASLYTDYFFADASFSRVLDSDPLTLVEGDACVVPYVFSICAFGQYWKSIANAPVPLAPRLTIPSTYFGISVGVGVAGAAARKFDGPSTPKM